MACSICYEEIDETRKLHCGHVFCASCISTWKSKNASCPNSKNSAKNATDASPRWIGFSRRITKWKTGREVYGSRIARHLGTFPR
mmetsp:Transcript_1892/g.7874  ORF Transcript_1892/g.7874 Transcript_1892/m.7874 type:complete len:85 (-) Transcript_1892:3419-3673(-)